MHQVRSLHCMHPAAVSAMHAVQSHRSDICIASLPACCCQFVSWSQRHRFTSLLEHSCSEWRMPDALIWARLHCSPVAVCAVFDYQHCKCLPGLRLIAVDAVGDSLSTVRCVPLHSAPIAVIAVSAAAGIVVLAAVLALAAAWVLRNRAALGPPGEWHL